MRRHVPLGLCWSTSCLALAESRIHAARQICPEKKRFNLGFFWQTGFRHTGDDRPTTTNYDPAAAAIEASTMNRIHLKFMRAPRADGKG